MTKLMAPVHPGEILKEEFMRPLSLSANALARAVRVPPNRISAIVSTTAEFWLNLQKQYELDYARNRATDLARIEPIRARA